MLASSTYIPDVYGRGNAVIARGEARNPSLVLDEKFSYLGGKEIKPKEQAADQRRVDLVSHFATTYNSFPEADDGVTMYAKLYSFVPDITTRNMHILAAAYYIINRIRKGGARLTAITDMNPETFKDLYNKIWPKLEKALSKAAKTKQGQQIHDVFRYMTAILAFETVQ